VNLSYKTPIVSVSFIIVTALALSCIPRKSLSEAEAHLDRGVSFAKQGRYSEAESEFREAIRINPDLAEAHAGLGILLAEQGRHREARAELERTAELFEKQGNYEMADVIRTFLKELPKD